MSQKEIYQSLGLMPELAREIGKLNNRFAVIVREVHAACYQFGLQNKLFTEVIFDLGEDPLNHSHLSSLVLKGDTEYILYRNAHVLQTILNRVSKMDFLFQKIDSMVKAAFANVILDVGVCYKDGVFIKATSDIFSPLFEDPFDWLKTMPDAYGRFKSAWEYLLKGRNADALTNAYSALEGAAKHVLGVKKALDNSETIGKLCSVLGLDSEWGILLNDYCKIAHEFSSRHGSKSQTQRDNIGKELVEFYLYQTGVILRLMSQKFPHK